MMSEFVYKMLQHGEEKEKTYHSMRLSWGGLPICKYRNIKSIKCWLNKWLDISKEISCINEPISQYSCLNSWSKGSEIGFHLVQHEAHKPCRTQNPSLGWRGFHLQCLCVGYNHQEILQHLGLRLRIEVLHDKTPLHFLQYVSLAGSVWCGYNANRIAVG